MHRQSSSRYLEFSFLLLITILFHSCTNQNKLKIEEIEHSLLPYVLIEGEPPFNLKDRMEDYKVPGVSIAVIKDYEILWTKHYGVMDTEIMNPITDNTIFNVGSLSKGVAALTVLSLVKDGKIELNRDINDQLISWKIPENKYTQQGTVTPLLLMNHSGGTMYSPSFSYLPDKLPTILQVLHGEKPAMYKPVVVDRIPGTEYLYSNAGYTILQLLVTDIAGKEFYEVSKNRIFNVLHMDKSTFQQPLPEELLEVAAAGHKRDGLPLDVKRYYYPHMAAGGLWTTVIDYSKFIIELQKSYHGSSNKITSQELTNEMLSSHVSKKYGLGVFLREIKGEKNYFGHLGDNRGFFAGFISHITDGYGAVVFTNSQNGAGLIREITRGIAKVYDWDKYLPEYLKTVPLAEDEQNDFIGRYLLGSDEVIEISRANNDLVINHLDSSKLFHIGEERFVTKFRDGFLQFEFDEKKRISSLVYNLADELGRFIGVPRTCNKMNKGEKIPLELLQNGKIDEAIKLYKTIKNTNPLDTYISENRLNRLGYELMGKAQYNRAAAILELSTEFYPESANLYDSLGEAYLRRGDKDLAIKNYRKSLQLNPNNTNAIRMLENARSIE